MSASFEACLHYFVTGRAEVTWPRIENLFTVRNASVQPTTEQSLPHKPQKLNCQQSDLSVISRAGLNDQRVMLKLNANDRTHAVTLAVKRGIIEL